MLDFSNVTENLLRAIGLLRFEHLSHVIEDGSELCDMFGQGTDLLIGVSHDVCRLVKFLRHRCAKGNQADDTSGNLGHCAKSLVLAEETIVLSRSKLEYTTKKSNKGPQSRKRLIIIIVTAFLATVAKQ